MTRTRSRDHDHAPIDRALAQQAMVGSRKRCSCAKWLSSRPAPSNLLHRTGHLNFPRGLLLRTMLKDRQIIADSCATLLEIPCQATKRLV